MTDQMLKQIMAAINKNIKGRDEESILKRFYTGRAMLEALGYVWDVYTDIFTHYQMESRWECNITWAQVDVNLMDACECDECWRCRMADEMAQQKRWEEAWQRKLDNPPVVYDDDIPF